MTYRRQIIKHNLYLSNIAIVLIFGITKKAMVSKVENILTTSTVISCAEETYLSEKIVKNFVLTNKSYIKKLKESRENFNTCDYQDILS